MYLIFIICFWILNQTLKARNLFFWKVCPFHNLVEVSEKKVVLLYFNYAVFFSFQGIESVLVGVMYVCIFYSCFLISTCFSAHLEKYRVCILGTSSSSFSPLWWLLVQEVCNSLPVITLPMPVLQLCNIFLLFCSLLWCPSSSYLQMATSYSSIHGFPQNYTCIFELRLHSFGPELLLRWVHGTSLSLA